MAEQTGIAWCDHTFNPWIGCTKVSAACDFCYAEALMDHRHHRVTWGGERSRTSASNWQQPLRWNRKAKADGVRRKVFCASLADVFDNQAPDEWRADLWRLIDETPDLDWLLLTKRPQNIRKMMIAARRAVLGSDVGEEHVIWPWPNVWLGTTVENQEEANRRIPALLNVPAAVRFISAEPLLEPVTLSNYGAGASLNWVICGGESGQHARPFHLSWARSLRDQCQTAGVAFFMKQLGDAPVGHRAAAHHGAEPAEWPADLRVREFPRPVTGTSEGQTDD